MKRIVCMNKMFLRRVGLSVGLGLLFLCLCIAPAMAERVVLPESLRIISEEAFLGDTGITSVMLPDGVEEIRSRAFAGSAITSLNLPSSITYIADDAFDACDLQSVTAEEGSYAYDWCTEKGLFIMPPETDPAYFAYGMLEDGTCEITSSYEYKTAIVLPAYSPDGIPVTRISRYAFSSSNLVTVVIPSGIQEIGEGAFSNCEQLTNVQMFDGLKKIEDYAFSECTALETLWLPNSVEEIGYRAFLSCTSLQRSNYPLNLTTYGYQPWDDCINLTLTIPEGITSIPDSFFNSSDIYGIVLPESMVDYPKFSHCANLKSITLPQSMKLISDSMFYGCSGLEQITLPEELEGIESYAFANCLSLKEIFFPDSLVQLEGSAFDNCAALAKANYPINWTINEYGGSPFTNCPMLKEFIIPEGVTEIAHGIFSGFDSLEYVYLPDSLLEIRGSIFENCTNLRSVRLPSSLTTIPYHAFSGCTALEDIVLPDSIETIEESAFYNCASLETINYPKNCTYVERDYYSGDSDTGPFEGCTSLKEIIIPEGTTTIASYAFYNCDAITELDFPDTVTVIGEQAFGHCDNLTNINYPVSWETVGSNSSTISPFIDCPSLTEIYIPEGVTFIASKAFSGCTNLRYVSLPESLENIGDNSFSGCTNLSNITLPDNLTRIGSGAFSGCSGLENIAFNNSLITIDNYAFSDCISLENAMLPDSVSYIGMYAFSGCTSLSKIHYPIALREYGSQDFAFTGCFTECPNLIDIIIPEGATDIPDWFFWDSCVEYISFPSTLDDIGAYAFGAYYEEDCPLKGIYFAEYCQFWSYANSFPKKEGVTVYGTAGSYAEIFATNRGYAFSTAPFPGFEDEEPDEPETPGTITFSGYVTFEDGMPLPDVEIYAYNAAEELIDYDCTDDDGAWSCEAIPDEQCTIRYYHDVYTIEPTEVGVITSDDMVFDTAIASVGGVYGPAVPSFTMQINGEDIPAEGVMVGDPVTFTITANNMTKVRLVADGRAYDEYYLTDGSATFDRNFSRAGERAIAFQAYTGSDWTIPCEAQTLVVNASGTLDEPVIHDIGTQYVGEDFTVTWDAVDNADSYTVYLYRDELLWPALSNTSAATTDGLSMEISGDLLYMNGEYLIEIIASGYGYSQSSSSMTFKVEATAASVEIAYPTDGMTYNIGDIMHTRMALGSGTAGARLLVTPPEGEETFIAPDESGVFYPAADFVGDYVLTPYYSASSSDFTKDTADGTGESVTVHVSAPKIISLTHDTNKVYSIRYSGAAPEFIGRVSDARYTVTVSLNGEAIAEITPEEDGSFAYTADALAAYGEYVYSFVPCYGAIAGEQKDFPVYIIEQQEASVRYAAEPIAMLGRPGGAMVATIPYAAEVTILGTYGTEYLYVSTAEASGFVAAGSNLAEAVEAGEIEVSVTETASVPYTAVGGVREYRIDHENLVSAYAEVILPDDETVVRYDAVRNETEFIIDIPVDTVGGYKCNFYASSMVDELIVCGMNTFFGVDTSYEYTGQECWSNKSRYLEDLWDPIFADREITSFDVTKHNMKCIGGGEDNYIYIETTSRDNGIVNYYMVHASEIQYVKNVTVYRALLIVNPYEKENVEDDVCMRNIERMTRTLGEIDHIYINSTSARAKDQDEIRNAINQFIAWSDYNDVTYIYWSGHGNGSSGQSQYSWNITPSENNPSDFYLYLSLRYQLTHFNGKVNLIIDSCYSGDFVSVPGAPDIPETVAILMATSSGEVSIFVSPTTGKPVAELGGKFTVAMTNYVAEHPNVTLEELKNNVRISGLVKEFPFWSSPTTTMWGDPNRVFFAPDTDEVN